MKKTLTEKQMIAYRALVAAVERCANTGAANWITDLDKAFLISGMTKRQFNGCLGALTKRGVYVEGMVKPLGFEAGHLAAHNVIK